jgi:hypothetical protein
MEFSRTNNQEASSGKIKVQSTPFHTTPTMMHLLVTAIATT